MKKTFKLKSRYSDIDTTAFVVDDSHINVSTNSRYMRFGYDKDSEDDIIFIDPEGGPYLSVGGCISDGECEKVIKSIKRGELGAYILEVE